MANKTVLDFPGITNDIQPTDKLYLLRGVGTDRDKNVTGDRIRPAALAQSVTGAVDLSTYQGDLLITSNPVADITITFSNYLNQTRRLIVINISAYNVQLAGTVILNIPPGQKVELVSTGSAFYREGESVQLRNYLINPDFDVWQRNITFAVPANTFQYTADRWNYSAELLTGTTVTRQTHVVGQTDVPDNPEFFLRATKSVGGAGDFLTQRMRGVKTLAGQKVYVSFYARYQTNPAAIGNVYLTQDFGSGGSGGVQTLVGTAGATTTSWQRFEFTVDLPSISGKTVGPNNFLSLEIGLDYVPGAPVQQDLDVSHVQVNDSPFEFRIPWQMRSIESERRSCREYYEKSYDDGVFPSAASAVGSTRLYQSNGGGNASADQDLNTNFQVQKRTTPTIRVFDILGNGGAGAAARVTMANGSNIVGTISNVGNNGFLVSATEIAPPTIMRLLQYQWDADSELY
jgi:hypothetical protein